MIINIFLITSSVLAEFKSLSLKSTVPYFRWTLYLVTIYYLSIKKLSFIRNFSLSFLVCFILFFIDSSIQFTFGKNIIGYETMVSNRISSFFKDELILGSFILKIVPIILFYLFLYWLLSKILINFLKNINIFFKKNQFWFFLKKTDFNGFKKI